MEDFIIEDGVLVQYKGTKSDVVIPKTVTTIGEHAFAGETLLTSVTIPKSVRNFQGVIFENARIKDGRLKLIYQGDRYDWRHTEKGTKEYLRQVYSEYYEQGWTLGGVYKTTYYRRHCAFYTKTPVIFELVLEEEGGEINEFKSDSKEFVEECTGDLDLGGDIRCYQ